MEAPLKESTDEALILAHRQGEAGAFEWLVRRYAGILLNYLVRMVGERHHAEDLLQETFLRVHRKATLFDPSRPFKPWLFTVSTRLALDWLRRRRRQPEMTILEAQPGATVGDMADSSPSPAAAMEGEELRDAVRGAVQGLPERQRAVLVLSYFQGLSYPEVADVLGCSVSTVKTHMSRALLALARRLPLSKKDVE